MASAVVEKTGAPLDFLGLIHAARDEAEQRVARLREDLAAAEADLGNLNITVQTVSRLNEAAASVAAEPVADSANRQDAAGDQGLAAASADESDVGAASGRAKGKATTKTGRPVGRPRKNAAAPQAAQARARKSAAARPVGEEVVTLLRTTGAWLAPREIAAQIGRPDTRAAIESVRHTPKKLVERGTVSMDAQGRYGIGSAAAGESVAGKSPAFVEPAETR